MDGTEREVAQVSPEVAEQLWREHSRLAHSFGMKADQALQSQREHLGYAEKYRNQVPAERLQEIDLERLERAGG